MMTHRIGPARKRRDDIPSCRDLVGKHGGKCPLCGYQYERSTDVYARYYGLDNGTRHRAYHREHVPVVDPRLTEFPPGDIRVDNTSAGWLHRLVYERARYLQQSEHYDFVQWQEDRGFEDTEFQKDCHALLLVEAPGLVVGATSFTWMLWSDHAPSWRLNFIWVAGTWRRKGVLSRRWLKWQETYGAFNVESPWSEEMVAFLAARGAPSPIQASYVKDLLALRDTLARRES